ncbi:MAG: cell surface protein, partial [Chloroflexi bacterium]|nr:cell surface protein [Chloroflexota bacterium]
HLLNGNTINQKILQGKLIDRRLSEGKSAPEILDELYVRALTRKPTQKEFKALSEILASEKDHKPVLEDIFWALMNSREFLFNH